jgi:autotransporter-associated beta strand protein
MKIIAMPTSIPNDLFFSRRRIFPHLAAVPLSLLLVLSVVSTGFAGSATWNLNPISGDWNTAANWTPMTVPNGTFPFGPFDVATFAQSNITSVSLSDEVNVNGIVFVPNASAFTIDTQSQLLRLEGAGIVNSSGTTQNIVAGTPFGLIGFHNNSTAGSNVTYTVEPDPTNGQGFGGAIIFGDSSTAGDATFTFPENTLSNGHGGFVLFEESATAGTAEFILTGGVGSDAQGAFMQFFHSSNADRATITVNGGKGSDFRGGGEVGFADSSGAGDATLIANAGSLAPGGLIFFEDHARGGSARVEVFGNGALDISGQKSGSVTIGSLEGDGDVFLGGNQLVVGRNDLSTIFSGTIQNGGSAGGVAGSLVKIGGGRLVLSNANEYSGGTRVIRGQLFVNNTVHSGTGSGPVLVEAGKLGGNGSIGAGVKIGTGSGTGASLSPGADAGTLGTLYIKRALTFNADGIYQAQVNSSNATADSVIANGVTINAGAQFAFTDLANGTLAPGTVFTIISNTSDTPIAGKFSNLADGSTFTSNGNTYRVNYQGGDGNDLTLTVQ